jgi:hypothetical protein
MSTNATGSRKDIYTGKSILVDSDEHVIPNFMGGHLSYRGLIDKSTNEQFGSGIDAFLSNALKPFLVVIGARSDRNRSSQTGPLKGVLGSDDRLYNVMPGGVVEPQPRLSINSTDGLVHLSGIAPNADVIRTLVTKWANRAGHGLDLVEKIVASLKPGLAPSPELTFGLDLFQMDCYRAIGKMACNLFAGRHPEEFRSAGFDKIRDWINGGELAEAPPVQLAICPSECNQFTELDHWVRVHVSETESVEGTVVVLGTFAFSVKLGTFTGGTETVFSYRVDQIGMQHRQDDRNDLAVSVEPFDCARSRTYEDFQQLAVSQLKLLMPKVLSRQRDMWLRRLIEQAFEQVGLKRGEYLESDAEKRNFANILSKRLSDEIRIELARHNAADEDESA